MAFLPPVPPPPSLSISIVKEEPAFRFTGVDFAGLLMTHTDSPKKSGKAWICLFTCFVTRAVHLDIVLDMSTETFIRCLKRFIRCLKRFIRCLKRFAAGRGLPISDNGKTFQAASRFFKGMERMVQSTKQCLKKTVGQASFMHNGLLTSVTEIESIINSRPLSYVSAGDTEEPLTPSHLLIGHRVINLPDYLGHLCDPGDDDFDD